MPMTEPRIWAPRAGLLALGLALLTPVFGTANAELLVEGDFETVKSGASLRRDIKGQDWYESRRDTKAGRGLLILSTKPIAGNVTRKAMIKAHPDLNTYLSQPLATAQTGDFTVQYDICVKEILPDDNHSAFFFVGTNSDQKRGPSSTAGERFVFLGFENASQAGKINLFAREGESPWEKKTIIAPGLALNRWYTISVAVYTAAGIYEVEVKGVKPWTEVKAFQTGGKSPKKLTHVSFASWNDGAGTFYVDNVTAWED